MNIIGLLIGFYGYLFPSNINLMVVHLFMSKRYQLGWWMLLLIVVFESLYCLATLYFLKSLYGHTRLQNIWQLLSYSLVFILGLWMIFEPKKNTTTTPKNTVYRGVFSVVIHPLQVPFWMVVGAFLKNTWHFDSEWKSLLLFVAFNALGTLLAMLFYIIVGSKIIRFFHLNLVQINKVMGSCYLLIASYQLLSLLF